MRAVLDMKKLVSLFLIIFCWFFLGSLFPTPAQAITDPQAVPNNKFGIHIISATDNEASAAAQLVNSTGGDWGYVTFLIEKNDRDHDKWQSFFNNLRRRHLIPIVRIATDPNGENWNVPSDSDAGDWANFLNSLIWPVKNRYVVVYNEPNQGQEWGGRVDPADYAKVLDQTITALKNKNDDFFVLNAGFDASAPSEQPKFEEEENFLQDMNKAVPGIFNKLDGWVSHSYPNPGFSGSPDDSGKGTIRTWQWEQSLLHSLGVSKQLPIFITETGWKHAEGVYFDKSLPTADQLSSYYQDAFSNAWNSNQIITVTPFLLDYQQSPFDHFSFKKITGEPTNSKILGASFPDYYPFYQTLAQMSKTTGQPKQDTKATLTKGTVFASMVGGESYHIKLTFKNIGESIWNESKPLQVKFIDGQGDFRASFDPVPTSQIQPGEEITLTLNVTAPISGKHHFSFQLQNGDQDFDSQPFEFNIQVKNPADLVVSTSLFWKKDFSGTYTLTTKSDYTEITTPVVLNTQGQSQPFEVKSLVPDYTFSFTLSKPFYQPKTIYMTIFSGNNSLQFGQLQLDYLQILTHPGSWWQFLPFNRS